MNPEEQIVDLERRLTRAEVLRKRAWRRVAEKDAEIAEADALVAWLRAEVKRLEAVVARKDVEIRGLNDAAESGGPADPARLLRAAARGRRSYLDAAPDGTKRLLEIEIATIENAARVVEGDDGPLFSWLPSHLWTAEMTASLYAKGATMGEG